MSLIRRRYVDAATWAGPFDPVAVPTPQAARVRSMLKELHQIRWTGRNRDGEPVDVDPDYLLDLINRAEAGLRPHAAGLL